MPFSSLALNTICDKNVVAQLLVFFLRKSTIWERTKTFTLSSNQISDWSPSGANVRYDDPLNNGIESNSLGRHFLLGPTDLSQLSDVHSSGMRIIIGSQR